VIFFATEPTEDAEPSCFSVLFVVKVLHRLRGVGVYDAVVDRSLLVAAPNQIEA
jgi:hypothetical protein